MDKLGRNVKRLNRLQSEGFKLPIEDFGTDYSWMAHLRRFPFEEVKPRREGQR